MTISPNQSPSEKIPTLPPRPRRILWEYALWTIVIIGLILAPYTLRFLSYGPLLLGDESYYHTRIAEQLLSHEIYLEDPLIAGGRPYLFSPVDFILAAFQTLISPFSSVVLFGTICALLTMLSVLSLLLRFGVSFLPRSIILFVMTFSPTFLHLFTSASSASLSVAVGAFLFCSSLSSKRWLLFLGAIISVLIPLTSIFHTILVLVLLFALGFSSQEHLKRIMLIALWISFVGITMTLSLFLTFGDIGLIHTSSFSPSTIFLELGGNGYSLFELLLAGFGLYYSWNLKRRYYLSFFLVLLFFFSSFFIPDMIAFSHFVVGFFAGYALSCLIARRWELTLVRNLSVLLLFAGILSLFFLSVPSLASEPPTPEFARGLLRLRQLLGPADILLTDPSYGYLVTYYARHPVLVDTHPVFSPLFARRMQDTFTILLGRDLTETRRLLSTYHVSHIFISREMREGLTYDDPDDGLLSLLSNNDTFKKEYRNRDVELYRVLS